VKKKPPERNPASAYDRALGLLARREHSARELRDKLARRGFDDAERDETLERLRAKDFQNDERFAEMLVRSRLEAGYGPRWIVAELNTHGIGEEPARNLIAAAEPDWPALALRQLRRRYGARAATSLAERSKRANFLLRRGFDGATVRLALGSGSPAEASDEVG
jgi:regulatory protein